MAVEVGLGPLALELATTSSPGAATFLQLVSSATHGEDPTQGEPLAHPVDPLPSRLLHLLSQTTDPLTVDTLRSKLQVRNQRVVQALRYLSAQGKVERLPRGYVVKP